MKVYVTTKTQQNAYDSIDSCEVIDVSLSIENIPLSLTERQVKSLEGGFEVDIEDPKGDGYNWYEITCWEAKS